MVILEWSARTLRLSAEAVLKSLSPDKNESTMSNIERRLSVAIEGHVSKSISPQLEEAVLCVGVPSLHLLVGQ